jgi:hypothetical protein
MCSIAVSLGRENGLAPGHAWVAFHVVKCNVENESLGAKRARGKHLLLAINTRKRTAFKLAKLRDREGGWDEICHYSGS